MKPKFSWLKCIGKGLVTGGKGAIVLAPIVLDHVVPILQGHGVKVSYTLIAALSILKVITNRQKNKDN